jgi:hypothetical protein
VRVSGEALADALNISRQGRLAGRSSGGVLKARKTLRMISWSVHTVLFENDCYCTLTMLPPSLCVVIMIPRRRGPAVFLRGPGRTSLEFSVCGCVRAIGHPTTPILTRTHPTPKSPFAVFVPFLFFFPFLLSSQPSSRLNICRPRHGGGQAVWEDPACICGRLSRPAGRAHAPCFSHSSSNRRRGRTAGITRRRRRRRRPGSVRNVVSGN